MSCCALFYFPFPFYLPPSPSPIPPIPCPLSPPSRTFRSQSFLQRVMSLYTSAHYKNQPNDLQMLSDAPAHHLFVLLGPKAMDQGEKGHLPDVLVVVQVTVVFVFFVALSFLCYLLYTVCLFCFFLILFLDVDGALISHIL